MNLAIRGGIRNKHDLEDEITNAKLHVLAKNK